MGKDVSVSVHADIDTATDAEPDASEAKEPNLGKHGIQQV